MSRLGYQISPLDEVSIEKKHFKRELLRFAVSGAFALAVMHLGLYFLGSWKSGMKTEDAQILGLVSMLLSVPVMTYGAAPFFRNAWAGIRFYQRLHTDILVCVALLIGFGFSVIESIHGGIEVYYDSVSMIVFLLLGGRLLIRSSTTRLTKPSHWKARVIQSDATERWLPAEELKAGDEILLDQGDFLPVDAELLSERAWIDESATTGESLPVEKVRGQVVKQLGVSFQDEIRFRVQATTQNSSYSTLVQRLQNPRSTEKPNQWEQTFVGLILLTAASCLLFFKEGAVEKAVGVLIVACPCALALSRPLVLNALKRQAFKVGIAVSEFSKLLEWSRIKGIAFDKTGTLTEARVSVDKISWSPRAEEIHKDALRQMCKRSQHPLSSAIAVSYESNELSLEEFQERSGEGLFAKANAKDYCLIAGPDGLDSSFQDESGELARIKFRDRIRPEASSALDQLRSNKLKLWLFTGDRKKSVERFVENFGINFDKVTSDMKPEDKASQLPSDFGIVGDGINDSAAMRKAKASLGIMGSAESNLQSAGAYLLKKDLHLVPALVMATRKARSTIYMNFSISFLYNVATIGLVLTGAIGPIICAIFMPLSSLTVVFSSNFSRYFQQIDSPNKLIDETRTRPVLQTLERS